MVYKEVSMKFQSVKQTTQGIEFKLTDDEKTLEVSLPLAEANAMIKQSLQILLKTMNSEQQREFLQSVQKSHTRRIIDESY